MGLFKDVKKPVIRPTSRATGDISPLRPRLAEKQPPCVERCPAGSDVRGWMTTIAQAESYGRTVTEAFELAWQIVADAHPFPATLGRICPHPCEHGCHRAGKDDGVAVTALERSLGDMALQRGFEVPKTRAAGPSGRVAVIGAGPAGLSCAYQLARRGHRVTVIEAGDVAGGRLRDAVRSGRMAAVVVDAEIQRILNLGVELRRWHVTGEDVAGLERDHDAVFVAVGRAANTAFCDAISLSARVLKGGDMVRPGLVAAALASGRAAAEAIDAAIGSGAVPAVSRLPSLSRERLKFEWYEQRPRADWTTHVPPGLDVVMDDQAEGALLAEAKRCLSCGMCMDCERCWMFCTNNCFEKLPRGRHYRVKTDTCNGCRKCADECPCGFIDMA